MGFVKKISAFAAGLILAGALCGCGNPADNFAPKEFKKISPENAGYVLYVPDSWTADISTGVTTAYVSAKDRSNISFMAFEADDGLIHVDVNGKTTDGAVTTDKPETTVPETKAPAETGTGTGTGTASTGSSNSGQVVTVNPSYVVLKPGATRTLTASVKPSSASQKFTFKSANSNIATVSPSGVITAVGTGATSITVSNGTASAMVTVIVNRSAASSEESSDSSTTKPEDDTPIEIDPVVQAIEDRLYAGRSSHCDRWYSQRPAHHRQDPVRGGRRLHHADRGQQRQEHHQ